MVNWRKRAEARNCGGRGGGASSKSTLKNRDEIAVKSGRGNVRRTMERPDIHNQFLVEHVRLLLSSYETHTGRQLVSAAADEACAPELFHAPFFVASHNVADDPVLTYGNETALKLFEMPWGKFIQTPSRFTAETPERAEREHLLTTVARQGYIDDYSGIRISSSGRRFEIRQATVWNLIDELGDKVGQAATFSEWEYL